MGAWRRLGMQHQDRQVSTEIPESWHLGKARSRKPMSQLSSFQRIQPGKTQRFSRVAEEHLMAGWAKSRQSLESRGLEVWGTQQPAMV